MYIRAFNPTNQIYCEVDGRANNLLRQWIYFSEEDILLLEFVKALNAWGKQPDPNFEYYSIDYEEGQPFISDMQPHKLVV